MPPTKKTVLDLPLRRRIVETVTAHPGIHLRKLAEDLGVAVSTLEYHCYQLVRTEHLVTRDTGGYKVFYPVHGVDRRDKDILYIVRQETPRRICAHLLLNPGATPKDLKAVLALSGATLTFHLNKLRHLGLLVEEAAGRTKFLHVADEERVANVLVSYRQSFVDQAVDRFASAWLDLHPPASAKGDRDEDEPRPAAHDVHPAANSARPDAGFARGGADSASADADDSPDDSLARAVKPSATQGVGDSAEVGAEDGAPAAVAKRRQ